MGQIRNITRALIAASARQDVEEALATAVVTIYSAQEGLQELGARIEAGTATRDTPACLRAELDMAEDKILALLEPARYAGSEAARRSTKWSRMVAIIPGVQDVTVTCLRDEAVIVVNLPRLRRPGLKKVIKQQIEAMWAASEEPGKLTVVI